MSETISIVGLGYVGLPMAIEMARHFKVIGFDISQRRIDELKQGLDRTREVEASELKSANIFFTANPHELKNASFHIVAVPTPVNEANQPDLSLLLAASETVGKILKKGDLVVYESTVYPGCTEEDCVPILEKFSGLRYANDFHVGYSPERINPGDKEHTFAKIIKVISATDATSLNRLEQVYTKVVKAGVFKARSIKVAEAAKVIENTQRDLNIALMNELSLIFERMGIDTLSVLEAAGTKWNFLKFTPGLVGGHCIGVDPYYLTHKAESIGYNPQVILAGRRINDGMGKFIAQKTIKAMIKKNIPVNGSTVTVLGLTFKENVPDLRNTKVIDIIRELQDYGIHVQVCDPEADREDALHEYNLNLTPIDQLKKSHAIIIAVAHKAFKELRMDDYLQLMHTEPVIVDVKGILGLKPEQAPKNLELIRL